MVKGSRQILQASSKESSTAAAEDDEEEAEIIGLSDNGEEGELKFAIRIEREGVESMENRRVRQGLCKQVAEE